MRSAGRKEQHTSSFHGHAARPRGLPQYPLAPVAKDRIAQTLRGHKGNLASIIRQALVNAKYGHPHERVTVSSSAREDLLKLLLGLDGLHGDS